MRVVHRSRRNALGWQCFGTTVERLIPEANTVWMVAAVAGQAGKTKAELSPISRNLISFWTKLCRGFICTHHWRAL